MRAGQPSRALARMISLVAGLPEIGQSHALVGHESPRDARRSSTVPALCDAVEGRGPKITRLIMTRRGPIKGLRRIRSRRGIGPSAARLATAADSMSLFRPVR